MGLTGLGVFSLQALLPAGSPLRALAYVIHPVGYIAVIIGRAQRFTENTLYPVILVMDECRHLFKTFRLWAVVFAANLVGAFLLALTCAKSSALRPEILSRLVSLGADASRSNGSLILERCDRRMAHRPGRMDGSPPAIGPSANSP